ncbi:SDR family oxidoreductase [Rhizobium sp. SG2393]|uniref:SDR family oxidoreductase n=1 Tax=Rhizobium sp. SG2393 TaxID=3276279 RepID=UPI00366CCBF0
MRYKTALVTGASKGIGAAIAAALVEAGLTVHAVARDAPALAGLADRLGPRFVPQPGDVRALDPLMARLSGEEIDVLVNNAGGLATVKPLWQQTAEETADVVALNLTAPLQLIQAVLPGMVARRRGHIFNLTSTAASGVFAGTATYAAAKAALSHAGRVLRYDLAGTGVRLTEIAPGRVETDFYLKAFEGDRDGLRERMYTHQRPLRPEDVAAVLMAAISLPDHADVAELVLAPTEQAAGGHVYPNAPAV